MTIQQLSPMPTQRTGNEKTNYVHRENIVHDDVSLKRYRR